MTETFAVFGVPEVVEPELSLLQPTTIAPVSDSITAKEKTIAKRYSFRGLWLDCVLSEITMDSFFRSFEILSY